MKLDIKALTLLGVVTALVAFFFFMPSAGGLQAAPNATLTTIDGTKIQLADLKGKPYLVVFWATDCPGCVEEIPDLIEFNKGRADKPLPIIAVAMPHDNLNAIRTMRTQKGIDYPIVLDQDGSIVRAFGGVKVTPTNFLISPQGKIVLAKMGGLDMNDLRKRIEQMQAS